MGFSSKKMQTVGTLVSREKPLVEEETYRKTPEESHIKRETNKNESTPPASYPKIVYILIASMLCEHLCESGLKSVMALYFQIMLGLGESATTLALHSFNFLKYFAVLIGATLADSYLGKINMVFYSQLVYSWGAVLLAVSSYIKRDFPSRIILILAMVLRVVGLGGILPCLIPLAADQISESEGDKLVKRLFIYYFFMVQICDMASVLLVPCMQEVPCFHLETCYPLAFGVPAALSIVSLVLFGAVHNMCHDVRPKQPIVIQGVQCVAHALRTKFKKRKIEKRDHWLDYADDVFDEHFIDAVKCTLNVLSIPIPLYWSLYHQQATTWTMQASRMNNELGPIRILPGQVQALCPVLLLILTPIFHSFLYNALSPTRLFSSLLRRMIVGGFLIATAFMLAFFVELGIEQSYPDAPKNNESRVNIINGYNSDVEMIINEKIMTIKPHSLASKTFILNNSEIEYFKYKISFNGITLEGSLEMKRSKSQSFFLTPQHDAKLVRICDNDRLTKDANGLVRVKLICSHETFCKSLRVVLSPQEWFLNKQRGTTVEDRNCGSLFKNVHPGVYKVRVEYDWEDERLVRRLRTRVKLRAGGVYTLLTHFEGRDSPGLSLLETIRPNSLSVLWLAPQYLLLSLSGVLFTVSAHSFIYTETPPAFKSFSWTACYMTLSVGNMVTVLVSGAPLSPSYNFLLFAVIMFLGMFLFIYATHKYKYANLTQSKYRIYPFH